MEICYDGTLVMPSSYVVMDGEEMIYVEGGGTIKVIASASTVRTIAKAGVGLLCGMIGAAFSANVVVAGISGALGLIIYDFIIDICGVKYKAINKKFSNKLFPNYTLNLNNYV